MIYTLVSRLCTSQQASSLSFLSRTWIKCTVNDLERITRPTCQRIWSYTLTLSLGSFLHSVTWCLCSAQGERVSTLRLGDKGLFFPVDSGHGNCDYVGETIWLQWRSGFQPPCWLGSFPPRLVCPSVSRSTLTGSSTCQFIPVISVCGLFLG